MARRTAYLIALFLVTQGSVAGCASGSYSQTERFDAVYECKKSPAAGELYFECLERLLPDMSDDEIDEVIDQGYDQP